MADPLPNQNQSQGNQPVKEPIKVEAKMFRGKPWTVDPKAAKIWHVEIEQPIWSNGTAKQAPVKLSKSQIVTYDAGAFRQFLEMQGRLAWEIVQIMHDPNPELTKRIIQEVEDSKNKKKA